MGRTGKSNGVPDVSPQVLLALRWMPRCLALGAAVIIEKNISYCCRPNLAFVLHQVLHTIAKFLVLMASLVLEMHVLLV